MHLCYEPFEVVVVSGPSSDGTSGLLETWEDRIKLVHCPVQNLSEARNLGIKAAAGSIIAFIDDDAIPESDAWLSSLVQAFDPSGGLAIGASGGETLHRDSPWYEFRGGLTSDYGEQVFHQEQIDAGLHKRPRWIPRTNGNNSAFSRDALVTVGGFDGNFTYYLDEADVCIRLARAGFETIQVPGAAVRHYPAPSHFGKPFIRNRRIITRSDTYFALKNGLDGFLVRIARTLFGAPRKHYFLEMFEFARKGSISPIELLDFLGQWVLGFAQGFLWGIFKPRRLLREFGTPPPFKPFKPSWEPLSYPAHKPSLDICIVSEVLPPDKRLGGIGRYSYDLACALHSLGHRVRLVGATGKGDKQENLGFWILDTSTVPMKRGRFPHWHVVDRTSAYAISVAQTVQASVQRTGRKIDVVHATNWNLEGLGCLLGIDAPLVQMLVTPLEKVIETEGWPLNDDLRLMLELDKWQIENSDHVTAPSNEALAYYRDMLGVRLPAPPRSSETALGISPALSSRKARKKGRRRRLVFVGRHERRKGLDILLEALSVVLPAVEDWQCHFAGEERTLDEQGGTLRSRFLVPFEGQPWLRRLVFHGTLTDPELLELYSSADLFVAPSRYESFGLVYLEAMQFGVPVVASDVGGVSTIVRDGLDGLLVPPGDPEALADALRRLMTKHQDREQMGRSAREHFREHFESWAMAERLLLRYRSAIQSYGRNCRRQDEHTLQSLNLHNHREVIRGGTWELFEIKDRGAYLATSRTGSYLEFPVREGELLLTARRHPSGGNLEVLVAGEQAAKIDLQGSDEAGDGTWKIPTPDQSTVRVLFNPSSDPCSGPREAWIAGIQTSSLPSALFELIGTISSRSGPL